jgi:predicted regulator of Ras-like GTPase activity (Roadblock/LC7/MglB family)
VTDLRFLFADLLAADEAALLVDGTGLVMAGAYYEAGGTDIGADIGAALSGMSDEAVRATRYLGIGVWRSITFETEAANVNLAPVAGPEGTMLVVAAAPTVPLGAFRRTVIRCERAAAAWCATEVIPSEARDLHSGSTP